MLGVELGRDGTIVAQAKNKSINILGAQESINIALQFTAIINKINTIAD